jgi:hypothetical protein
MMASVFHHFVQRGASGFRAANTVIGKLLDDLEPIIACKLPEFESLCLWVLVRRSGSPQSHELDLPWHP